MIKAEKGEVKIDGKGPQVIAELMIICAALKEATPKEEWKHVANYWIEEYTDARIYETESVTAISKDPRDLTIALAYVLCEISKRHPKNRDRIIKLAFEIGADLEQNGHGALLEHRQEVDELEGHDGE